MSDIIIRPSIEKYMDASGESLKLFDDFLKIWKERDKDIDVIEARRIYMFMIQEDQKRKKPHIGVPLLFSRHSWVVGEYPSKLARRLEEKHPGIMGGVTPDEIEYGGGSHDIAKMLIIDGYQYAHEHLAWLLLRDNSCRDLASLVQPHQPGEKKVLKMLHDAGDFLDISEEDFCTGRLYPLASDLIMLADMSCGAGYDGAMKRMGDILLRYNPEKDHLAVGINDPEDGATRILGIEQRVKKLLT